MPAEPLVRSIAVTSLLSQIRALPPNQSAEITKLVPADLIPRVERAGLLLWLPFKDMLALVRATHKTLKPTEFRRFTRTLSTSMLRGPLLGGVITFGIKVTGTTPKALARVCPTLFGLCYNFVEVMYKDYPNEKACDVEVRPSYLDWLDPAYIALNEEALGALLEMTRVEGQVTHQLLSGPTSGVVYKFRWI